MHSFLCVRKLISFAADVRMIWSPNWTSPRIVLPAVSPGRSYFCTWDKRLHVRCPSHLDCVFFFCDFFRDVPHSNAWDLLIPYRFSLRLSSLHLVFTCVIGFELKWESLQSGWWHHISSTFDEEFYWNRFSRRWQGPTDTGTSMKLFWRSQKLFLTQDEN